MGPLVVGIWAIPSQLSDLLTSQGKPLPKPVSGYMLIDTGATRTAIAKDVAESDLGLRPTSVAQTYGAGGLHKNPCYLARFMLQVKNASGDAVQVVREFEVLGIPDLGANQKIVGGEPLAQPRSIIGLLGRDFLRHTTLSYRGESGVVEVRLHLDTMSPKKI